MPKTNNRRNRTAGQRQKSAGNPLLTAGAIAVARDAVVELGEGGVGAHLGATRTGDHSATHRFAADVPGYGGWEWVAVVACAPGSDRVTVNEVALQPGSDALRAPDWVPYADRVRPGDLGPGDVMPPRPDDERLVDAAELEQTSGADRPAIPCQHTEKRLTRRGLDEALHRWRGSDFGPTSEFARHAALHCGSCAFWIPLPENVVGNFGVCTNEYAADGHVAHSGYGCGAHSDTPPADTLGQPEGRAFDDESTVEL
ncbi:DUF3027 domain-containing protein [Corynebacterium sp. CCM 9187]|uniref:DUF3027 domain-containing protein n=1 Tax=Corynebacterium pygosceleis TaxID=2800406 RepID=A0A9Q4C9Q8_9CORY|nr:DUF3027 domain-containing protein [Corynebacterium pygosceleis]MCK7638185.1 DUF3027 domain-containing protein [Corynebacterium pygosceleis]MCK7675898.1 DUF3027 domain-containing protein [Corynebacterium pygosceleis]MCL0120720.1 DUF3027 domain-containing protein [Corynebacterium pygosceleis]MCX7444260.1 DUF3027 domain-containing protein [Corynebacterium pygosceleis]MCX7468901.1 DUF3027 domain-containing protein [Corynebacterium pygosceleis]